MVSFNSINGVLQIGGLPISGIVASYGTPLFIYDRGVFESQWVLLRKTLPAEFSISYSVKANPNPAIIKFFLSQGSGLEIASVGEFQLALYSGCLAPNIIFAGPGKTEADLEYVLSRGIGEIHVESLLEIDRISTIGRRIGVRGRIAVRINPSDEAQGGAMRMGGKPLPFGIDEEKLDGVINRITGDTSLDLRGLHVFAGTQILDHTVLIRQYRKGLDLAVKVARQVGHPLHTLDFGGGLGIPYFAGEKELDMEALGQELMSLISEVKDSPLFAGTHFVLEPGRYLVGKSGVYVCRVTDIKMSRGKKFLIVDGGMHHHLAASGNLGQVIKKNFPIAILSKMDRGPLEHVEVVGPLCTPLDVLARDTELPAAEVGDLIGVFQSGAYARTSSPLGFLSHPSPAEVLVYDGQPHLIRRRGNIADLFADLPGKDE